MVNNFSLCTCKSSTADLVGLAVGDVNDAWDIVPQVQERLQFDGRLGRSKLCPVFTDVKHSTPKRYPCYAFMEIDNWAQLTMRPVYLYQAELEAMVLELMATAQRM